MSYKKFISLSELRRCIEFYYILSDTFKVDYDVEVANKLKNSTDDEFNNHFNNTVYVDDNFDSVNTSANTRAHLNRDYYLRVSYGFFVDKYLMINLYCYVDVVFKDRYQYIKYMFDKGAITKEDVNNIMYEYIPKPSNIKAFDIQRERFEYQIKSKLLLKNKDIIFCHDLLESTNVSARMKVTII